jgi:hypothetical protein
MGHEKVSRHPFAFAFGYCINFCIYATLRTRATVWLTSSNILSTVHTSHHPTLQHHNSYNRTENHRQGNAVRPPDDGRKDARNMSRNIWLPINHCLLHLVRLTFIYLTKMHGHPNIKIYSPVYSYARVLSSFVQDLLPSSKWLESVWQVQHLAHNKHNIHCGLFHFNLTITVKYVCKSTHR